MNMGAQNHTLEIKIKMKPSIGMNAEKLPSPWRHGEGSFHHTVQRLPKRINQAKLHPAFPGTIRDVPLCTSCSRLQNQSGTVHPWNNLSLAAQEVWASRVQRDRPRGSHRSCGREQEARRDEAPSSGGRTLRPMLSALNSKGPPSPQF